MNIGCHTYEFGDICYLSDTANYDAVPGGRDMELNESLMSMWPIMSRLAR